MTAPIVCGTDFSSLAEAACDLAHQVAQKQSLPCHLIHVAEDCGQAQAPLRAAAERLGAGVRVECQQGLPDEVLAQRAEQIGAGLLVVGSLGRRSVTDWLLGSTAERVVRLSKVPTLVVRQPERIMAWLAGERPLRLLLAVSLDGSVEPALRWIDSLSRLGPVESLAVQVAGGPHLNDEWYRQESESLQRYCGWSPERCHVEVCQWSVEEHLLHLAERQNSDLIVMGTRQRTGLERMWRGSVSMAVLRRSQVSVACVPG
jgi:nucleotide-binding universal stress UspA family protein